MGNSIKPRIIAFYLPQFHPTPENDRWWGKGFTEWTNVAKAKPLFRGHHQPHIPADLGFYDLRLPESRIAQAEMARFFGISAFCYWHYWFGKGKKLLNYPFEEVVRTQKPDFPFCLAWANHSWYNKQWSSNSSSYISLKKQELLIEQKYEGAEDYIAHFYDLLSAFKDDRYYKVHGKLLYVIFSADDFSDFPIFKQIWNELAEKENLPGFFFVAHNIVFNTEDKSEKYKTLGYDAINFSLHAKPFALKTGLIGRIKQYITLGPNIVDYKKAIQIMDSTHYEKKEIYPTIIPNWDHTPRSGRFGRLFKNCTPELFGQHVRRTFNRIKEKPAEDQIVFLKSWNEWGEGNYLEPDLEYGTAFGETLRNEIESYNANTNVYE